MFRELSEPMVTAACPGSSWQIWKVFSGLMSSNMRTNGSAAKSPLTESALCHHECGPHFLWYFWVDTCVSTCFLRVALLRPGENTSSFSSFLQTWEEQKSSASHLWSEWRLELPPGAELGWVALYALEGMVLEPPGLCFPRCSASTALEPGACAPPVKLSCLWLICSCLSRPCCLLEIPWPFLCNGLSPFIPPKYC